jgi:hypothetical protein
LAAAAEPQEWRGRVGPNVQVSAGRADVPHEEVVVASHPKDAGRLVVASMTADHRGLVVVYSSADGGRKWAEATSLELTGGPTVAFGPDGTGYLAAVAGPLRVALRRSQDGGTRWEPSVPGARP